MLTVFELIKFLPKTNCGDCGEPTCMAFATKVITAGLDIKKCPHLEKLPEEFKMEEGARPVTGKMEDPETALLRELRQKIKGMDLALLAPDLGAQVSGASIELPFFNDIVVVSSESLKSKRGIELDPRDQILIYNYCFFGGKGPLSGEWVGLESFPNSVSKVSTLRRYTEDKLAAEFSEAPGSLKKRVKAVGGQFVEPCSADLCFDIRVFPKVVLRFHYWQAEPEEGFDAKVKVLYDRRAIEFLDLESLVFAAERAVEKILEE